MTRVAAFDCGTNSLRLLIADVDGGDGGSGGLVDITRSKEIVRLGQGVDRTGRFDDAALERTLAVTREYARQCREQGVERMRFVATSATRDAANRDTFLAGVTEILGVTPEVISGDEEARLSFLGAASALPDAGAAPRLIVDVGGGSTELVLGGAEPTASHSMDVGCVRMTERHARHDPPARDELAAMRADVNRALDEAQRHVDLAAATAVVGVAGTVTTITAHALRLASYDPDAIHGARLPLAALLDACAELAALPRDERAALPYMDPGRVDVIAAGAVVWACVLERIAALTDISEVATSEHDILDGIALSLAATT